MYKKLDSDQMSIYDFVLPFGGHLDKDNRWVKLRESIDWKVIDEVYEKNFDNKESGNEAYPACLAFGSLYIQRKEGFTDEELVNQLSENPYMQYFVGYKEFSTRRPFDSSLLVTFRKRLTDEMMNEISEKMFLKKDDDNKDNEGGASTEGNDKAGDQETANKGTVIIDATCTPADIAYPTDIELCDKARRWTEVILDHLWMEYGLLEGHKSKPRTYRETARKRFLNLNKRRKKSPKKIRKEIRYQLGCIRRNLNYIEQYGMLYGYDKLFKIEADRLGTIYKFYEQQKYMYDNKVHSVENRIVSLSQPWVRPIVRGKSKAPTEFGAVIEKYRQRFGYYPGRVLADKIYRSQANRRYCKEHGIRISGPRLGRKTKDNAEEIRQELKEIGERNAVEGKFGNGKRKLGLGLIMGKLKETSGSMIGMDIFVLNMEHRMRECAALCCAFLRNRIITLFGSCIQVAQMAV